MEETVRQFGLYYLMFISVLYYMFRKYIISIFDPFLFTILMMASSLSLSINSSFFIYVLLSVLGFTVGFRLVDIPKRNIIKNIKLVDLKLFEIFTALFFVLFAVTTTFVLIDSGIPLFSDNPSEAKTSMFVEGTGWIRRITFLSPFLAVCICLNLIVSKNKFFFIIIFLIYTLITVLGGSKSGLIGIVAIFWYLYQQDNLWVNSVMYIKRLIKTKIKYFVVVTLSLFVFIAIKESESDGAEPIYSIGFRLMEFGDVMLYYGISEVRNFFLHLNFIDFILYEINGVTGMLRFTSYYEPLGYQMVKASLDTDLLSSDVILGPNTVFIVRGHIFFGFIGGIIYCFLMGYLASYFRKKILELTIKNIFIYALGVYLFFQIPAFLREFNQSVSSLFDMFLYLSPLLLFSILIKEFFYSNLETLKSSLPN